MEDAQPNSLHRKKSRDPGLASGSGISRRLVRKASISDPCCARSTLGFSLGRQQPAWWSSDRQLPPCTSRILCVEVLPHPRLAARVSANRGKTSTRGAYEETGWVGDPARLLR